MIPFPVHSGTYIIVHDSINSDIVQGAWSSHKNERGFEVGGGNTIENESEMCIQSMAAENTAETVYRDENNFLKVG